MTTTRQLKVESLQGVTFGTVITGIDLTNLSSAMWADIESAFNEHGMLIFPEQHLAADSLATFAKRFGDLQGGRPDGDDRARSISNRRPDRTVLTKRDPRSSVPSWLGCSVEKRSNIVLRGIYNVEQLPSCCHPQSDASQSVFIY
jgi:hypothetical protein